MATFALSSLLVTQPVPPATTGEAEIVVEGTDGSPVSLFISGYLPTTPMSPGPGGTASYSLTGLPAGFYNGDVVRDSDGVALGFYFIVRTVQFTVTTTDETSAGASDGTVTLTGSHGTAPYYHQVIELALFSSGTTNPTTFAGLPTGAYTARLLDSSQPGQMLLHSFTIRTRQEGCTDEYADNYDPAATVSTNTCTYTPRWRSAWQPMAVRVAAQAGQQVAFVEAELRIGFRAGHPLAADRPLGAPLALRATVAPDGYATFCLGQYLRPQLGAPDGAGGYRLDLNSATAFTSDLYVGYELRRPDGTLLEHGYALNAAVPDGQLASGGQPLLPFSTIPLWAGGWAGYQLTYLADSDATHQYGQLYNAVAEDFVLDYGLPACQLPCPPNPLPVAWLAPGSGYGFWVFQGKSVLGDTVGEGQRYREASTGEARYSDPGEAYRTYKASSGVFKGDALLTGLRTLWRSPQAWAQLVPGGEWVPILVGDRAAREVGRLGVVRNEVALSFQVAAPEWAQGQ